MQRYRTRAELEVEIEYEILPPAPPDFPLQIDITGVYILIQSPKSRPRRVNVLGALSESDIISLEDEILTPEFIERYHLIQQWQEGNL